MDNHLSTQRLTIELMTLDDADLLFDLDQDPQVMKYINGGKTTSKADIQDIYIPRLARYLTPAKGWGLWKVFNKCEPSNGKQDFLGWILIRPMGFFSEAPNYNNLEIGWRFKKSSWGKGIATESAQAVMQHLLATEQNIKHFSAIADEQNLASINIMKKLGMDYIEKRLHPDVEGDVEVVLYSLKTKKPTK
ncbi:GNAT family N-acetyltransferase [Shewanella sp. UCD-KL21]|uniref:GNAT family N-acetyltransferase n=1 Tax=Shewanella sp. UCD-KL21 TaxID=1917164 RepID=UPI000970B81A|nr:GNAT family N-acetyltransferase [Shewanella sp. UCD-KL21]